MSATDLLSRAAASVALHIDGHLSDWPDIPVTHAMRHALGGGKALRGALVLEGGRLHGMPERQAIWPAAGVEALHAYSLVHDDLPAMDDDDLRRGRPTVHVAWNEATAILAGDALQSLAFELVSDPRGAPTGEARSDLALSLARASGGRGMVLGQALDIAAETADSPLDLRQVEELQSAKTGALIVWAAEAGARMAGADPAPLSAYGTALGRAFQIADDLLDATGDAQAAGKRLRKDAEAGKATFVELLGIEGAKTRANALVQDAQDALAPYGPDADPLRALARFVIARNR
ncbi:polyprenyl synthetase family protein [Roseicyclus sp. F158]|uniref:Polyprenyl synthetase family protein n=1 Tax=Tropicimonas omnivorans TaxID=3075590 RepID=A0ABU3DFD7_9RHOB|nr:polyprenyl synthetase family protein [Roseicyclus sp. F158]MDT0681837.1 polyprenyl synthetase family protein [Roseicyclus sp. F158]